MQPRKNSDRFVDHADAALQNARLRRTTRWQLVGTENLHSSRGVMQCGVITPEETFSVVAKVNLDIDARSREQLIWGHQVAAVFHDVAERLTDSSARNNPVVQNMDAKVFIQNNTAVRLTKFVQSSSKPVSPYEWGRTVGTLHEIGASKPAKALMQTRPKTNNLAELTAESFIQAITDDARHPFRNERALILQFARLLEMQARESRALDPNPLLIHGDLHPLNVLKTNEGPKVIDFDDAAWGNRSADWSWLWLLSKRYGMNFRSIDEARAGYEETSSLPAPSHEQIETAGRKRELLFIGFSIRNANLSSSHLREALKELPALSNPHAQTPRWQLLVNPAVVETEFGMGL